jgi:hypothetical protein
MPTTGEIRPNGFRPGTTTAIVAAGFYRCGSTANSNMK